MLGARLVDFLESNQLFVERTAAMVRSQLSDHQKRQKVHEIAAELEAELCRLCGVRDVQGWVRSEFLKLEPKGFLQVDLFDAIAGLVVMPRWFVLEKYQTLKICFQQLISRATKSSPSSIWNNITIGQVKQRFLKARL